MREEGKRYLGVSGYRMTEKTLCRKVLLRWEAPDTCFGPAARRSLPESDRNAGRMVYHLEVNAKKRWWVVAGGEGRVRDFLSRLWCGKRVRCALAVTEVRLSAGW